MHEMGIANSVLDAVRAESLRFPNGHIHKVGVRIGELAGVDPAAMSFCFEALVRDTELEPLSLQIDYCPQTYRCRRCQHSFSPEAEAWNCPLCGAADLEFAGGDELVIAYLEVEDGTSAAGA
jgi:hydrogenase nickel incorporation protein HypA/HybF